MSHYCTKDHGELPPLPERAVGDFYNPSSRSSNEGPFHTVRLWEFTNLYVLLRKSVWEILSNYLKKSTLSVISRELKISSNILSNIRKNPHQSIVIPNLRKICLKVGLDLNLVEKTTQAVRFNKNGGLEDIPFPFCIDIYAWRLICHIIGDGSVSNDKDHEFPKLVWNQLQKHQHHMRTLIKRLSRVSSGKSEKVYYPKALTYTILGTMPGITIYDLSTTKFIQFVIDLPPQYKDWKVQFLAAFLLDDGSVSRTISFTQKDKSTLQYIMRLCDQLGYDHSPYPPRMKGLGVHYFLLRRAGIEQFFLDLNNCISQDPLLGLWHKQDRFNSLASSFSLMRGNQIRHVKEVCITIIKILGDNKVRSTKELRNHPELLPLLEGKDPKKFYKRLNYLGKMGLIREVKPKNTSRRQKFWKIPLSYDPEILIKEFSKKYCYRSHPQSR
jgi:hypothetical protein